MRQVCMLVLLIGLIVPLLEGSGLESNGIGPRGRSMGFALAAMADDWSVIHYNPAGAAMLNTNVSGWEYEFFTGGMSSSKSLRNLTNGDPGRGDFIDPFGGEPTSFSEKEISSDIHFGAFGFVNKKEDFAWGFGLYGSGSGTAWEDDVNYGLSDRITAKMAFTNGSANIPVVFAWEIEPDLAVGLTLGFHWGMLEVQNKKTGTSPLAYVMDTTQDTDGIALGLDLGIMWKPQDNLTLGGVVKLPYTFRRTGETDINQSLLGLDDATDTTVDTKYPLRIALGAAWNITNKDLLGLGITWLGWRRYRMMIDYDDSFGGVLEDYNGNPGNWRNTIRLHAGYERKLNAEWDLRFGFTYDQAPEPEAYRTLTGGQTIDAYLLTAGAGVQVGKSRIDFGYIYTYAPPVDGYIPDAEYRMILHEIFIGMVTQF